MRFFGGWGVLEGISKQGNCKSLHFGKWGGFCLFLVVNWDVCVEVCLFLKIATPLLCNLMVRLENHCFCDCSGSPRSLFCRPRCFLHVPFCRWRWFATISEGCFQRCLGPVQNLQPRRHLWQEHGNHGCMILVWATKTKKHRVDNSSQMRDCTSTLNYIEYIDYGNPQKEPVQSDETEICCCVSKSGKLSSKAWSGIMHPWNLESCRWYTPGV